MIINICIFMFFTTTIIGYKYYSLMQDVQQTHYKFMEYINKFILYMSTAQFLLITLFILGILNIFGALP